MSFPYALLCVKVSIISFSGAQCNLRQCLTKFTEKLLVGNHFAPADAAGQMSCKRQRLKIAGDRLVVCPDTFFRSLWVKSHLSVLDFYEVLEGRVERV